MTGYKEPPKDTRFGAERGNKRSQDSGDKPWSIRHSVQYLARQQIDMSDPNAFKNMLPAKPTIAQVIAANTLAKASKADMRAVEYATDQIDGKLAQTNLTADLAAIMGMSDDDLRKLVDAGQRFDSVAEGGVGEDAGTTAFTRIPRFCNR